MNILVTGGAGFIGSHLVDELIQKKHKVFVIDDLSTGKKELINPKAKFYKKSIQDKKIAGLFKINKYDIVFHLAAQKNLQFSKEHPIKDADINILGSLNILENAKKFKVKKIIFYSTAAVYDSQTKPPNKESDCPNPATPYGIAKYSFEKYLQNSRMNYTILRLSNVFGPRQDAKGEGGVVSIFCENLVKNKKSTINNTGRQTRDFIYVDDVVNASVKAMRNGNMMVLNVSTSQETSVNDIYKYLQQVANKNIMADKKRGLEEQFRSALSNQIAKKTLNWKIKNNIKKDLKDTYNWFEEKYA